MTGNANEFNDYPPVEEVVSGPVRDLLNHPFLRIADLLFSGKVTRKKMEELLEQIELEEQLPKETEPEEQEKTNEAN